MQFGAVEAGGTKFVCGVGTGPDDLVSASFPTTVPEETLRLSIEFLRKHGGNKLRAIGIGSFGPVDLQPHSVTHGFITSTPKAGWNNFDLKGTFERNLNVPAAFDTDVNAAMLGESIWGAARGLSNAVYITVGTGIGGGALAGGRLLHGLVHPEMGHLRVPHDRALDPFDGCCPFHGDCLEGLASGPAILARWGAEGSNLSPSHPAWPLESRYLALALANITFVLSPERIILGGGVMHNQMLLPMIRKEFLALVGGYIQNESLLGDVSGYIVPPGLASRAGILGALALAQQLDFH